jgi:hypothetical protein
MNRHEPSPLLVVSHFNRKCGRNTNRRWNVWYRVLRCPVCGREFTRLSNPLRGRSVMCVGNDRLRVAGKH